MSSWKRGNLIDGKSIWDESNGFVTRNLGYGSSLWCRDFHGEKERDVAILKTKRWNCGACKQLVGEGEGIRSIISMVSISLEGFTPSILLLVVIIVAVVIIAVILVVIVIDAIVGVVIVVASIGVVVVMIIGIVVIVDSGVSHINKLLFVIIVTFPSMLWGSPSMKASIIFSVFGTMFGHKTENSWNLLTNGLCLNLQKINQKPDNIYTRSETIRQSRIRNHVFIKYIYIEAQFIKESNSGTISA
nr:hypothetical protein [Tanacetum cinerariifolium]